jgi:hypothetical protein
VDLSGVDFPACQLDGRSVVACDLFREGGVAVLVRHRNERLLTLNRRANLDDGARGITVALRQKGMNRHAIGARLRLSSAKGLVQTRWISTGEGYLSSGPAEVFFGLPPGDSPEALEVLWPGGKRGIYQAPAGLECLWLVERE